MRGKKIEFELSLDILLSLWIEPFHNTVLFNKVNEIDKKGLICPVFYYFVMHNHRWVLLLVINKISP